VYDLKLIDLAGKYPEHEELIRKLWKIICDIPEYWVVTEQEWWTATTGSWDYQKEYPEVPRDVLSKFSYEKVQLWELTEGLGDYRHNASLQRALTVKDFPWVCDKALLTDEVIAFCEVLRYY